MERNRTYECMCVLDNREVRKGWEPLKSAVTGLFTKHEAKVISSRRWDERRLAYPINGQRKGAYWLIYFRMPTNRTKELTRQCEIHDHILRQMFVKLPERLVEPIVEHAKGAPQEVAAEGEEAVDTAAAAAT